MRLIHYKVTDGYNAVVSEHNSEVGGEGDLTDNAHFLVRRKLAEAHDVPDTCIVIANIIQIKEK